MRLRMSVMSWFAVAGFVGFTMPSARGEDVDYRKHVKPILESRCYACHGALKQKGKLRLDTAELAMQGGRSGPSVEKGSPAKSELILRVTAKEASDRMPPEHEGTPLSAEQIDTLRRWIQAGAPHPADEQPENDPRNHWAFRPITRPAVPTVKNAAWVRNPIDAFVSRQHQERGLTPLPEASRALLLRRLSLDLIGLPPTLEEITAFQNDARPDWYEQAVNRLLNDPRHGERWARHWMDIWRYSDWWGLGSELRNSQKHIWHWRDWIVESLNKDTSYDEMVRQMLAADELYPNNPDKLRATGFLARNYFLFNRHQWMDETVEHVSKAFLGLTMNCVRCHDHKYDPFPQISYYRMRAFFEPYHARLDLVPGETDLERDGIPRVFDAAPNDPTYRFVRGDEKNPDKSMNVTPGVPELLTPELPAIQKVNLPVEAWQPQRHDWVIPAYVAAAKKSLATAETNLSTATEKRSKAKAAAKPGPEIEQAEADQTVAEAAVTVARAELTAIEKRAKAWQAIWNEAAEQSRKSTHAEAVRAERELAVAKAKQAVTIAKRDLQRSAKDKQAAATKTVKTMTEALAKAETTIATEVKPTDKLVEFIGARWTPTRFFSSSANDPLPAFLPQSTGRRTALAKWITDRRNTLTARVAVNHIWTRHFGTPLIPTVFDLGRKGEPPTHPELLDWLASELIDSGWSMKHLHRLIVQSATYRLSPMANTAEVNRLKDGDNVSLWKHTTIRLESQAVRDTLLTLAGTLDPKMGGPTIPQAQQADSKRRSIYFFHSNNERNLFLTTFDEALVTDCYRREQSIIPQQALAMTNSRLVLDLSHPIAEQITKSLGARNQPTTDDAFIDAAFLVLLASEPTATERKDCLDSLAQWRKLPEASKDGAGKEKAATNFARANLVWVLLNHNDFITIR